MPILFVVGVLGARLEGDVGLAFWIFASVAGLFAVKSTITGLLCFAFRMPRHLSLEAGLLLGQGGEFAFVVGRVGRMIGQVLDAEALPYLALDLDSANVAAARAEKLPVFFGDASRREMLNRVHLDTAAALVVTLDDRDKADRIVRTVRARWPALPLHARARHRDHAARLIALGTDHVVPETLEGSLQLAGRVLHSLGASDDVVRQRLEIERDREIAALARGRAA